MNKLKLQQLLNQFFIEDIGDRDITSDLLFGPDNAGEIVFLSKEAGIFSGVEVIKTGFNIMNPEINIQVLVRDGDFVEKGKPLATASGNIADLLKGERVILNLVQRMSGIATKTHEAVSKLNSDHTRICDTRKTTPGLRMLEKYAVRCGGGYNHRFGLYDAVMIKDNHISFAGSISKAVDIVRSQIGHQVKIEVETESKDQVLEAIEASVDVIMFDNRTPEEIKQLQALVPKHITTEASGGIQIEDLANFSDCGVDYISLGCLTHSVKSLDISVKMKAQ